MKLPVKERGLEERAFGGKTPGRRGHSRNPRNGSKPLAIAAQITLRPTEKTGHPKMEPFRGHSHPRMPREKALPCLLAAKIIVFARSFCSHSLLSFYCILLCFILAGKRPLNQSLCLFSQTLRAKTAREEIKKMTVFETQSHTQVLNLEAVGI